jgi:hypothetical protein
MGVSNKKRCEKSIAKGIINILFLMSSAMFSCFTHFSTSAFMGFMVSMFATAFSSSPTIC